MTEHDQRVCPRCGEPAGDHHLWSSCGLNIGSLSETLTRAEREASDVSHQVAQEPREAVPSTQTSAAESNGLKAIEIPTRAEREASDVSHEVAQEPREAVPSAQTPAAESNGVCDEIPGEASAAPVSEIDSDQSETEDTTANLDPVPPRHEAQPGAQHDGSRSVVGLWLEHRSRRQRVAFVCLVAFIGLVGVLTGRGLRR